MRLYRSCMGLLAAWLAVLALPAHAASGSIQAPAPALSRYMLISDRYRDMFVEVDGQRVLSQPVNTLSGYVAISSDRPHTVAVYGVEIGVGEKGPTLMRRITNYRPAGGFTGIEILTDDGIYHGTADEPPPPADKSVLHVIYAPGATAEVRFGTHRMALDPTNPAQEPEITRTVNPQTALLEVRAPGSGKLLRSQYLRAQPGYRYEIIVLRPGGTDGYYDLVVVPASLQLAARPTETRLFAETGHYLEGRFRHYWETTGGLPVFGFPLNDDHLEETPEGDYASQVFERNRFEYHPEHEAPYDVLLGRLGDERLRQLGRDWRKEWVARPIGPGCDEVQTGNRRFALCEPFRTYYRTHGLELDGRPGFSPAESLALLGLPLTQARVETNSSGDRVLTQWFERARLEHHPENPASHQVLLGRLGAEVYDLLPLTFDDEDRGFRRMSDPGRPDWTEERGGFGGHFWWTCAEHFNAARWMGPGIRGNYEVQVFVPNRHANGRNVSYDVRVGDDEAVGLRFNQKPYSHRWVALAMVQPLYGVGVGIRSNTEAAGDCTYHVAADAIRLVPRPAALPTYRDPRGRYTIDYPFDWTIRAPGELDEVTFDAPDETSLLTATVLPAGAAPADLRRASPSALFSFFVQKATTKVLFSASPDEVLLEYSGTAPDGKAVAGALYLLRRDNRLYTSLYRTDPERWTNERIAGTAVARSMKPR